jgi:crotonobetaine/carnitine-CoA ligase
MMRFMTVPELVAWAASRFPGRLALRDGMRELTFRELARMVDRRAAGLASLGVGPGDRVLIAAGNSAALVEVWLGAMHVGALPVAVNPSLTPAEAAYVVEDIDPRLAVTTIEGATIRDAATGRGVGHEFVDQIASSRSIVVHRAGALEPAAIVYTSGTTSRPKGVLVRHAAYTETGRAFPRWIGLGEDARLWVCLPLFHINAQAYSLMSGLAHGYAVAISERFHATTFWSEAQRLDVTHVNVVGAMLTFIERQPETAWVESPLRTMYAAPAPTAARWRAFERRFGVRLITGFGMTENTFGCAETTSSRYKDGAIGVPRQPTDNSFVNEVRVVTPDSRPAGVGERGELQFRNPVLTPGYWRASEATARAIVDGWLRTGDAAYRDASGDVVLVGRYKEVIRRRGENIAPAEVEDVLLEHEAVRVAAVFGVPSEDSEEEVVAAVVLVAGSTVTAQELRELARTRLSAHKVPSIIRFYSELPMTPTARVDKVELRRRYLSSD